MEFTKRKLTKKNLDQLYRVKIDSIEPCQPIFAPAYVYLKENERVVPVKAPLDFFSEAELSKLKPLGVLYLSTFAATCFPFREAGKVLREELDQKPNELVPLVQPLNFHLKTDAVELSATALKSLGSLWWSYPFRGLGIEPFFASAFVHELCDPLPSESMLKARESSPHNFDLAILRSSWVVILALILGYTELAFLNELRLRIFEENLEQKKQLPIKEAAHEIDEIVHFAYSSLKSAHLRAIYSKIFENRPERVAQKISSRLELIKKHFARGGLGAPSIYGPKGFIDG